LHACRSTLEDPHAKLIEQAGADALELNVYGIPTRVDEDAAAIERKICTIVEETRRQVHLPIAVKLSAFYTAPLHFGAQLSDSGADGLVLFNRFYEPDIDVDALEAVPRLALSSSAELPLRLRWLAVMSAELPCSLAVTGGVHTEMDAIKSIMCGAHAVQMVSALLRHGPGHIAAMLHGMSAWLGEHEYRSLDELRGSMNARRCPDPAALTRGNYIHTLQSWRV
jgi:Dihydroorotate dehydrogenase